MTASRIVYDEVGGFGTLLLIYGKDWARWSSACAP
jgi:hypothetical protein